MKDRRRTTGLEHWKSRVLVDQLRRMVKDVTPGMVPSDLTQVLDEVGARLCPRPAGGHE